MHSSETRCLLSDACVLEGRPLVSGSALRWEGQITVYNCGQGPCFRCLNPVLPPAEAIGSCADSGVIGGVVGAVGCLQAVEAVKILMGRLGLEGCGGILSARMIMYDGLSGTTRNIKLRGRQSTCSVCSATSQVSSDLAQLAEAYRRLGCPCTAKPIVPTVTPSEFAAVTIEGKHIVVDVRRSLHSDIVSLPTAVHLPLKQLCCASGVDAVLAAASGADGQPRDV
jgi:adenylyltransferase/sulfurtransferase